MERVTVSSKGQIVIPKNIRNAFNLSAGVNLNVEVRGQEIVLSRGAGWRELQGIAGGKNLMKSFATFRRSERKREDAGS